MWNSPWPLFFLWRVAECAWLFSFSFFFIRFTFRLDLRKQNFSHHPTGFSLFHIFFPLAFLADDYFLTSFPPFFFFLFRRKKKFFPKPPFNSEPMGGYPPYHLCFCEPEPVFCSLFSTTFFPCDLIGLFPPLPVHDFYTHF